MIGKYIDAEGVRTYYIEAGKGLPLVLLHGGAVAYTGESSFFRQIEALSDEFRVITFDQIGFGRTDMPKDGHYKNRLQRCGHTVSFLKALGIQDAVVCGHSEGGFIAARLAITNPELLSRLVFLSSGSAAPMLGGDKDNAWIKAAHDAYDFQEEIWPEDELVEMQRKSYKVFDDRMEALFRKNYRRALQTGEAQIFRSMPIEERDQRLYNELQKVHLLPYYDQIRQPTMLIWSSDDATVPVERGVCFRDLIPHADLHILAQAGHAVMHDRSDAVNNLLRSFCRR